MMLQLKDQKKSKKEFKKSNDFSCQEYDLWCSLYKDRWKESKYWDSNADKLSCLVGYFCHLFNKFYGYPYVFSFDGKSLYKGKDFTMARRILNMFDWNAREAKIYIRWVFEKRVKTVNYTVYSFGFFASQKFVNEYFHAKNRSMVLRRYTKLPQDFLSWCKNNHPDIFQQQELETWNDLNGLISHIKIYNNGIESYIIDEAVKRRMLEDKFTYKRLED